MIQKNNCENITGGFVEFQLSPQSLDTVSKIKILLSVRQKNHGK
jgi:hypothetical protein